MRNTCAIFGTRTLGVLDAFDDPNFARLRAEIRKQISMGTDTFVTSAWGGYEYAAAVYVVQLRRKNKGLKLIITHTLNTDEYMSKTRYGRLIGTADEVKYFHNPDKKVSDHQAYEWILSKCDKVVCVTSSPRGRIQRVSAFDLSGKEIIKIPTETDTDTPEPDEWDATFGLPVEETNHGKRWTAEEDSQLKSEFESGMLKREMAQVHGRSERAVEARLEKLGLITLFAPW